MRKGRQRVTALVILVAFLLTLYPAGPPAYGWSDSGLPCKKGTVVNITNFTVPMSNYIGVWDVQISGAVSGSGKTAYFNSFDNGGGLGYNFVSSSSYTTAAQELNGNPSFVTSRIGSYESTISWGSGSQKRTYIRRFAELCGAVVTGFSQGVVYVMTTPYPSARISPPSTAKAGEQVKIAISGTSFVHSSNQYQSITYKFYVDSGLVDSGSGTKSFSKQVSHTFPTAKTYTLKLEVTDGVGRTTTTTETISVQAGAKPPAPPPGGNMPPVADFELPPSAEVNEPVNVRDRSVDYDGTITRWEWSVSPSSYTGTLGNTGGTLKFTQKGTYTVKLTVTDNKGAKGECTKYIAIGESLPPPPPPEPPEPENKPPVARFSMPSECGPGQTVNVTNRSYDPDGYIVEVKWRISPSTDVEENLGDDGGTLVFHKLGTYTVKLTVTDDRGDSDSTEEEIEVVNQPPRARIVVPDKIVQGDDVTIRSASRDPDGEIVKLTWSVTPAENVVGELEGEESTVYFDKEGQYKIALTVEDNWGATDTDEVTVTVEPAIPQAFFTDDGAYKQNRRIVLTEAGQSSARYPIIKEQDEWEILPAGNGATSEAIRVKDVSPDKKEVLFKTPGTYKVRLRVTNTAGHTSEWYERTLDIRPDEPPVADFVVQQAYLRDPAIGKKATVEVRDTSYSPDGDIIAHRTWKYRYDSNNDGNFEDEQWVVFSDGNEMSPSFQTDQVGKYQIELEVTEGFGEDTLTEFVSAEDYLKADTSSKPLDEKKTEVINIRPSVGFDVLRKKKADIIFTVGNTAGTGFDAAIVQYLDGLINQYLKPELEANSVDYNISSVQTSTITTQTNFPWVVYNLYGTGFGSGDGQFLVDGTSYRYRGYGAEAPIDHLYYDDGQVNAQREFTFNIDMTGYNACATIIPGFIFGANDKNGFSGYIALMWHDKVGVYRFSGSDHTVLTTNGAGQIAATRSPSSFGGTQVAYISTRDTSLQKSFKMVYKAPTLEIYDGGVLLAKVDCPQATGNGYGVAAANSAHGCGARSYIRFENFKLETSSVKTLDEVLKNSSLWRDDAAHFLVNISAATYPEFNDPVKAAYIYSRLLNDRVDFSVLGSTANQAQAMNIIARNDGQGTFILNSNRNTAMQQLTSYIINKLNSLYPPVENYVLLNEEVYYKTYYNDPEEDPKMAERWKYSHDPNYFENSLGLAPFHEQWLPAPVYRFDKVGEFVTTFQARDNPKDDDRFDEYRLWSYMPAESLHLYVHRRPVAMFGVSLTPVGSGTQQYTITEDFEDTSYNFSFSGDWVRSTNQRHGGSYSFKSNSIGHSQTTSTQFNVTIPSGATDGRISFWHLVKSEANYDFLRIYIDGNRVVNRSGDGSWQYYEQALSPGEHTVKFEYTKDGSVSSYDDSAYVDDIVVSYKQNTVSYYTTSFTSDAYDLDHISLPNKGIVEHRWFWRPATSPTWNSGRPTTLAKDNDYLIKYEVKDMEGVWSFPVIKLVSTRNVNMAPVAQFTVKPNPAVVNKTVTITDMSYDPNGDPITQRQWRVRPPGGAWSSPTSTPPTRFGTVGEWTIELKVSDGSLWSEPFYQTVQVIPDNTPPVARFTVQPNPVYDCDPVTYTDTSYDPDGDPIVAREWRIRKDGGAWQYFTNPPTVFENVGGAGVYDIELRVQDQPRLPQLEPKWSDWYRQTLTVLDSFRVIGSIEPNPGERGRNVTIRASAVRISNGQPVEIDSMKVIIPLPQNPDGSAALPPGGSSHEAWMTYNPADKTWSYTYTIPERTVHGRWPDDGTYLVKVVGYRNGTAREDVMLLEIKGHIQRRLIIRTLSW
ncbi:PKD domain-containing protein [Desulfofundulus salinus]|nr:PKD domain-containing protein [Desulfofundulus salinum]